MCFYSHTGKLSFASQSTCKTHLGSSKGSVEIYLGGALMNTKFLGKKEAIN